MNLSALQHSAFLQSLGWAIANSLWQAAALWIVYHLISGVYKSASAKFKNNLSTILLSSAFVWFCITLFNKYFTIENLPGNYEAQFYQANNIAATTYNWNDLLNNITGVLPYLSVAYLLLLIFLSLRLINIYRFTRFIKFNGLQKPGVEWKLFTEKVARHMGITKKIRLWVSHHIDVPATIGFIKPVILIPLASINRLSADQLEAIILHELSHIKRNDYLINLFISIIETILFFNPFVVLLARIIKRERENCCDDFVIQYQYDRHAYASALLSLEQFRNIDLRLAIGATSGKKQLLLRIKRIMEINTNTNFNYGQKLAALLLITGIICSVAWLSPQNKENKKQLANNYEKVYDRKINRDEKLETLIVTQSDNKVKNIVVKPPVKKEFTQTERQLKELKDLNIKELAAIEYKRINLLLQESKKEIIRKKINLNKILMARGATYTPSLFDNGTAMLPFKSALAYADFNSQQAYIDLQKLQLEWDKAQFSFSFDGEQMQNAIKQVMNSKQLKPLMHINQDPKDNDPDILRYEKLIRTGIQNSAEKNLKRVQINRIPKTSVGFNEGSFYFVDSLTATEIKVVKERTNQSGKGSAKAAASGENMGTAQPKASTYAYTYGYGINTTDEKEIIRISGGLSKSKLADGKIPVTPVVSGSIYRVIPNGDAKTNVPKPKISSKDNIRIEYKNGIVVINGKQVVMPDTNEMLALYSLKGKKILLRAKNLIEPHIDD